MSQSSSKRNVPKSVSSKGSQSSGSSGKPSKTSEKSSHSKSSKELPEFESEKELSFLMSFADTPKPTLGDYGNISIRDSPLFPTAVTLDSKDALVEQKADDSFLVTGFGMRNWRSLYDALQRGERSRLEELYRKKKLEEAELKAAEMRSQASFMSFEKSVEIESTSTETETSSLITDSNISEQKLQLEYLMGLETLDVEEETGDIQKEEKEKEEELFNYSTSAPMRNAQKYLRVHRIFDFFQFITAHLLGACPDNPISFIIELLNKCLLYRSGMGEPPLLYEKEHITQLFCLMDRMGSGLIDMEQYRKGMATLGICDYNKFPYSQEGMVDKETFVEEVYDAEVALFQDLIGRKWMMKKTPMHVIVSRGASDDGVSDDSGMPYFIPSDIFKSYKKEKLEQIKEEVGEFYGE
ncbi:hypothetical protein JTB14_029209 [Gonioctena quinquepunctata]|nr:hypothetical protein JTB14_029209 [Gonioctena quinquepunctata]